jgi:hypothetical protein
MILVYSLLQSARIVNRTTPRPHFVDVAVIRFEKHNLVVEPIQKGGRIVVGHMKMSHGWGKQ